MAGDILYFMHRHVRLLTTMFLVLLVVLLAGGVAGLMFGGSSHGQNAAIPIDVQAPPAA